MSHKLFYYQLNVRVLLEAAAMAIIIGFRAVFGDIEKSIVCCTHVERHIKSNLKSVIKEQIKTDLTIIQRNTTT